MFDFFHSGTVGLHVVCAIELYLICHYLSIYYKKSLQDERQK